MSVREHSAVQITEFDAGAVRGELRTILPLWTLAAVVGVAAVWLLAPDHLFDLPRQRPWLWLAVMVFYPLVSVYPQELVFRAFVLQRYRGGPEIGTTPRGADT